MYENIVDILQPIAISLCFALLAVVFALCIWANAMAEDPPDDMGHL